MKVLMRMPQREERSKTARTDTSQEVSEQEICLEAQVMIKTLLVCSEFDSAFGVFVT
jgi:hypothetical protein